jgi:hypothetical protein
VELVIKFYKISFYHLTNSSLRKILAFKQISRNFLHFLCDYWCLCVVLFICQLGDDNGIEPFYSAGGVLIFLAQKGLFCVACECEYRLASVSYILSL